MTNLHNLATIHLDAAHRRIVYPHFDEPTTIARFVELQALVVAGGTWADCMAHAEANGCDIRDLEDSFDWWDRR